LLGYRKSPRSKDCRNCRRKNRPFYRIRGIEKMRQAKNKKTLREPTYRVNKGARIVKAREKGTHWLHLIN
jgi:hypothetical protein